MIYLISCTKKINVEGATNNFIRKHFCLHELLQKIISNYGSQFLSKLFHAILKGLGIKSAMSTTYHP